MILVTTPGKVGREAALRGLEAGQSATGPNPETTKSRSEAGFREAAEGIRTLDLLHGKQTL